MSSARVFELRTYHAAPGKLDALQDRFRDHTLALFDKHGVTVIGFWVPFDAEGRPTETLVYLLAFESREAARSSWRAFLADPAWSEAKVASERQGSLTTTIESVFMAATDFSPLS